jgi:hypothetical protein
MFKQVFWAVVDLTPTCGPPKRGGPPDRTPISGIFKLLTVTEILNVPINKTRIIIKTNGSS